MFVPQRNEIGAGGKRRRLEIVALIMFNPRSHLGATVAQQKKALGREYNDERCPSTVIVGVGKQADAHLPKIAHAYCAW